MSRPYSCEFDILCTYIDVSSGAAAVVFSSFCGMMLQITDSFLTINIGIV